MVENLHDLAQRSRRRLASSTRFEARQHNNNNGNLDWPRAISIQMLLNTTNSRPPVRITEAIVGYYFHDVLLLDAIEINYMSNISPT
ncbi:hypothetical protein GZH46_01528, partial [Fragariocoptes setiger]